jgi:NAD(P)-dependent dehydrogenase (short-subunit alcohol dehydrogenase family)
MQKTAIVTGAYGNLGRAVVQKFISEGYAVFGTIMPGEQVPDEFPATGFTGSTIDLTNEDDAAVWIRSVAAQTGSIDAAVLTVGGFAMGTVADTDSAAIQKQYKLNFETTYHIARPVFGQMMQQKSGRIFMIGARPGLQASFSNGMVAYGLAKSLVIRLAELMNQEAKGKDVVTTVVIPSTIDTPQNRKAMPDANFNDWVKPEDIAASIYFYCTPAATSLREPVLKLYGNA